MRLVDQNGEMEGVVPLNVAFAKAEAAGLDLVEISPHSEPPVCKILDFGKYRYESKKKVQKTKKKQKVVEVKEIKLRPNIGKHDLDVKVNQIKKFIGSGEKVKITLRFKGREISHQEIGMNLVNGILEEVSDIAQPEVLPKVEGVQIVTILVAKLVK